MSLLPSDVLPFKFFISVEMALVREGWRIWDNVLGLARVKGRAIDLGLLSISKDDPH